MRKVPINHPETSQLAIRNDIKPVNLMAKFIQWY